MHAFLLTLENELTATITVPDLELICEVLQKLEIIFVCNKTKIPKCKSMMTRKRKWRIAILRITRMNRCRKYVFN